MVSGISDNAVGAVGVSKLYEQRKKEIVDAMPDDEKASASPETKRVWESWYLLRCEMHKIALWSSHFVGGKVSSGTNGPTDPSFKLNESSNPDKLKMVHGRVEFYVQARLTAWPHLRRCENCKFALT